MTNIIVEISKYILIILFAIYTYKCFSVFRDIDYLKRRSILRTQSGLTFAIHFIAFLVLYLTMDDKPTVLIFYASQAVLLILTISLYTTLYPKASRLVLNNMCMLIVIGFIMLTRLNIDKAIRQFMMITVSIIISFFIPLLIRRMKSLRNFKYAYAIAGIVFLLAVLALATVTGGAKLSFSLGPVSIQPSEFVKILFVFYVASSLWDSVDFKNVLITSCIAAVHVLILVASTDLGGAVIFFTVYLIMLYVATRKPAYLAGGILAGCGAAVLAYKLFRHVRIRVAVWKDPFANWDYGYQVGQSLFAIGTGGWFGMGLMQGMPDKIPVVTNDFIFSAIAEELGGIFALFLILVCVSCYVMFLNIAMQIHDQFYKLIALGLGTCYIFQVFLNIGGVTKFIPSTGVTLPWISYGGSSIMSTAIMFAIIQGLYILREDEDEELERRKALERRRQQHEARAQRRRETVRTRSNDRPGRYR